MTNTKTNSELSYQVGDAFREMAKAFNRLANPFKVGDGVSWSGYSDSYAGTIVKVTPTQIHVQEDKAELLNGFNSGADDALTFTPGGYCGHVEGRQRYAYKPNPDAPITKFTYRKATGRFVEKGRKAWASPLRRGRAKHHDYNF